MFIKYYYYYHYHLERCNNNLYRFNQRTVFYSSNESLGLSSSRILLINNRFLFYLFWRRWCNDYFFLAIDKLSTRSFLRRCCSSSSSGIWEIIPIIFLMLSRFDNVGLTWGTTRIWSLWILIWRLDGTVFLSLLFVLSTSKMIIIIGIIKREKINEELLQNWSVVVVITFWRNRGWHSASLSRGDGGGWCCYSDPHSCS